MMNKRYSKKERKGLPGGPHEQFTYVTGVFSQDMYHVPIAQEGLENNIISNIRPVRTGFSNYHDVVDKERQEAIDYISSDGYLKLLFKNYKDPKKEQKIRLNRVKSVPVNFKDSIGSKRGYSYGMYYPDSHNIELEHSGYKGIPLEEFNHSSVSGRMSNREKQGIKNAIKLSHDYHTDPVEVQNRLMLLKKGMKEAGLYDFNKEEFTKDHLLKLKESIKNNPEKYNYQQINSLIQNVKSDNDLIWLMNNVAYNDTEKLPIGQKGGEGYRIDAPDYNARSKIIKSKKGKPTNITMTEQDGGALQKGPLLGIDNMGNQQMMFPGYEYQFPGDEVMEIPVAQGGIEVGSEDDPRYQSYRDSLIPYNAMVKQYNIEGNGKGKSDFEKRRKLYSSMGLDEWENAAFSGNLTARDYWSGMDDPTGIIEDEYNALKRKYPNEPLRYDPEIQRWTTKHLNYSKKYNYLGEDLTPKDSYYNLPTNLKEAIEKGELEKGDIELLKYYESLGIPNEQIGYYNSADVFSDKVKAIGNWFGKAWNPVYPKPKVQVNVKGKQPLEKLQFKDLSKVSDFFKHHSLDSSFKSISEAAKAYGIENYKGTEEQDKKLIELMIPNYPLDKKLMPRAQKGIEGPRTYADSAALNNTKKELPKHQDGKNIKKRILKEYPGFENILNKTKYYKTDILDSGKTGFGDTETIFPNIDTIKYINYINKKYLKKHPDYIKKYPNYKTDLKDLENPNYNTDNYTVAYNPENINLKESTIPLSSELFHISNLDPVLKSLRKDIVNTGYQRDPYFKKDVSERIKEYPEYTKKEQEEIVADGYMRNILYNSLLENTGKDYILKNNRYHPEEAKDISGFYQPMSNQIINYLQNPQGYPLPQVNVTAKRINKQKGGGTDEFQRILKKYTTKGWQSLTDQEKQTYKKMYQQYK